MLVLLNIITKHQGVQLLCKLLCGQVAVQIAGRADIDTLSKYGSEEIVLGGGGIDIFAAAARAKAQGVPYFAAMSGWRASDIQSVVNWNRKKRNSTIYGSRYGNIGKYWL